MVIGILLLDEGIVLDIGGEESFRLRVDGSLGDIPEGTSKFILTIFARNISTISRHLSSPISLTHPYNFIYKFIESFKHIIMTNASLHISNHTTSEISSHNQ